VNTISGSTGGKQKVHGTEVSIAIPASIVSDTPHLREKTSKIGAIGRTAAIFKVEEIIIYPDNAKANQTRETDLITLLLSYMETPQYLRKRLFKLEPELQYAGILPPLRTAHHPLERTIRRLRVGEYREGVTLSKEREGTLVDVGVEQPALILNEYLPIGQRITVKIQKIDKQVQVELTGRDEIRGFWGYSVTKERQSFGKMLKSRKLDLTIATSRLGTSFAEVAEEISARWRSAKTALVAFGAPNQGLHEIARFEGLVLEDIVDFVVNTIPSQGTETVRTEEALIASLAVLNVRLY
jgi:hypothetical protein